jgi:nicotinamidase-related amidase
VIDKHGYGSFHGTDLDARLTAIGVRLLVVVRHRHQICVEETAREAFHHGYRTTVADAVSSFAPTCTTPPQDSRDEVRLGRRHWHGAGLA